MKRTKRSIAVLTLMLSGTIAMAAPQGTSATTQNIAKVAAALPVKAPATPLKPRRVLIFDRCQGYRHRCIPLADKTFVMLGEKTGAYKADISSDMAAFSPENLAKYDALLLNNTTKLVFNPQQRKALMDFVKGGKGLIGIHAASDNFYDWPEAAAMLGGQFNGHPWHAPGTWAVKIDDPKHPLDAPFNGKGFKITDEIYQIKGNYSRANQRVLLSLDMSDGVTRNVKGKKRSDNDFAIAWIKPYGKGRVFYCSLGHNNPVYWNPAVLRHYLAGIQYALGDYKVDDSPSVRDVKKKSDLDTLVAELAHYKYGGNKTAGDTIAAKLRGAPASERRQIEKKLDALLGNPDATVDAKKTACRLLRRCATAASVPALEKLLTDPQLSHLARFALQGLDAPEADAALLRALPQAEPTQAIGIVGTLGMRRTPEAVPALAKLAVGDDTKLADAAIRALGHIGTSEAIAALQKLAPSPRTADALLDAAERMVADEDAAEIYYKIYKEEVSRSEKIAALRGLVLRDPERSIALLTAVLKSSDSKAMQLQAAALLQDLPEEIDKGELIAGLLEDASVETKPILINALAQCPGSEVADTLLKEVDSDNPAVRSAALEALGGLKSVEYIPVFLQALSNPDKEVSLAAKTALAKSGAPQATELIIAELSKESSRSIHPVLFEILAARQAYQALPLMIEQLASPDSATARAAVNAIGSLGSHRDVAALLQMLNKTDSPVARRNAAKAISLIAAKNSRRSERVSKPVAEALPKASPEAAAELISVLRRIGDETSLNALEAALQNPQQQRDAVKALCAIPGADQADALLQASKTAADPGVKILALRGYANCTKYAKGEKAVEICGNALQLAERPQEITLALANTGSINSAKALAMIEPLLGRADVRTAAESAYAAAAFAAADKSLPEAKPALEKVAGFSNAELAKEADERLKRKAAAPQ